MKKRLLLFSVIAILFTGAAIAQNKTISGKVTDVKGTAIEGAAVKVSNLKIGTLTKSDGSFSLSVPPSAKTLTISYVGAEDVTVPISSSSITVSLKMSDKDLSEVIITGYQKKSKRDFAGSAGTVSGEAIRAVPIASFDQALQGLTPGLILRATSGQPGNSGSALIRGRGSLQGSTDPLYIVDGIQIAAADFALLNPNDIENVSVLKDAVAASIYGSRGGNGVIVITTRKGKAGKTAFDVDAYAGWSKFPAFKDFRVMTSNEKIDYELRRGGTSLAGYSATMIDSMRKINTNWEDLLTQVGKTYSLTASASGGTDKTRFFTSLNYYKQDGTLVNTGFDRVTGRINLSHEVGNLSIGMNTTGTFSNYSNTSEINSGIATPLNALQWTNPYEQPFVLGSYNAIGNFVPGGTSLTRPRLTETGQPIATTQLFWNTNATKQYRIVASGNAEYKIPFVKGLSVKTVYGIDYRQFETGSFVDRRTSSGGSNPKPTSGATANYRTNSYAHDFSKSQRITSTSSISYGNKFGNHTVDASVYYEYVEAKTSNSGNTTYSINNPFQNESGATISADLLPAIRFGGTEARLKSYFTNINYGFKNKYFITGNLRSDASSRFGTDKRSAIFGGGGFSWIISDESFFKSAFSNSTISNLKFKISYGTLGNQEGIGAYDAQGTVAARTYNSIAGTTVSLLANTDLQWESRKKFNTGLEFALFNKLISGSVEYYNETTADLFFAAPLSYTTGFSTLTKNIGSVRNSGVEVSLNADLIKAKDLRVSINANFSYNKNQVLALAGKDSVPNGLLLRVIGQPINSIYVVDYVGVNPANGNALYRKLDGTTTETYSVSDKKLVGNSDPNIYGGFGLNIDYKGVNLNAQFSYMLGSKVYNNERANLENPDYYYDNVNVDLAREWKKAGDITDIPGPIGTPFQYNTTRFVEDNSFLRLRNITLSYNLGKKIIEKANLRGVNIYVSGTNLLTWTKYRGRDPEYPGTSLTGAQYPALKTVQAGVRFSL